MLNSPLRELLKKKKETSIKQRKLKVKTMRVYSKKEKNSLESEQRGRAFEERVKHEMNKKKSTRDG